MVACFSWSEPLVAAAGMWTGSPAWCIYISGRCNATSPPAPTCTGGRRAHAGQRGSGWRCSGWRCSGRRCSGRRCSGRRCSGRRAVGAGRQRAALQRAAGCRDWAAAGGAAQRQQAEGASERSPRPREFGTRAAPPAAPAPPPPSSSRG
eukprot:5811374-Prymnesium_polylepis.1